MALKRALFITERENFYDSPASMLIRKGFRVDFIKNGALALEMLKENSYYIIIADKIIKNMSAFFILCRMKALNNETPFVITAERANADDILTAYELGAFDIVDTKYGPADIETVIEKALNPAG